MLKEGDYFKVFGYDGCIWLGIKDASEDLTGCVCCVCIFNRQTEEAERELWSGGIIDDNVTEAHIAMASPEEINLFDDVLANREKRTIPREGELNPLEGALIYNKYTKKLEPIK